MLPALSLIPYLFGLGSLLFLACRSLCSKGSTPGDCWRLQLLATVLLFGVLLNHSLALWLTDLRYALMSGGVLAAAGLITFLSRRRSLPPLPGPGWLAIALCLYLACLFAVTVEPVEGWDARSIWFFHAKMIYYHGSVDAGGDWSLPAILFSHPDYPELVPILAAQTSFLAGYWNEYLPKLSLVALLVPALLALISILKGRWWHPLFICVPLLFTNEWLKNGYMDGYLALYAGLASFFWGRWLYREHRLDLVTAMLCTGVVLGLKNEGMLYCLIVALGVAAVRLAARAFRKPGSPASASPASASSEATSPADASPVASCSASALPARLIELAPVCLVAVSGVFLWGHKKQVFQLKNDLSLGLQAMQRASERLGDGSLGIILNRLYVTDNVNLSLGIFLLSLVVAVRAGRRPGVAALFCLCVGLTYFSGIVLIYLATPCDLIGFHLPTGNRTMLPVHLIFLAAALCLFKKEPPADSHPTA